METPTSNDVVEMSKVTEDSHEPDLYHRPQRLVRIASLANILSWVTLAFVVLVTIFFVSIMVMTFRNVPNADFTSIMSTLTSAVILIIPGLFLFVALQAVSESIYILMDIEENTRAS